MRMKMLLKDKDVALLSCCARTEPCRCEVSMAYLQRFPIFLLNAGGDGEA